MLNYAGIPISKDFMNAFLECCQTLFFFFHADFKGKWGPVRLLMHCWIPSTVGMSGFHGEVPGIKIKRGLTESYKEKNDVFNSVHHNY